MYFSEIFDCMTMTLHNYNIIVIMVPNTLDKSTRVCMRTRMCVCVQYELKNLNVLVFHQLTLIISRLNGLS